MSRNRQLLCETLRFEIDEQPKDFSNLSIDLRIFLQHFCALDADKRRLFFMNEGMINDFLYFIQNFFVVRLIH